jgi:hypothetical protein
LDEILLGWVFFTNNITIEPDVTYHKTTYLTFSATKPGVPGIYSIIIDE